MDHPLVLSNLNSYPQCYLMATPPYPKSRGQRGISDGRRHHDRDVRVSLQRITEMTSAAAASGGSTTSKHGLTLHGTTMTSSATEETTVEDDMEGERRGTNSSGMSRNGGGFESSNTLSEYLNAGDLYDSLKGG